MTSGRNLEVEDRTMEDEIKGEIKTILKQAPQAVFSILSEIKAKDYLFYCYFYYPVK